ncbi:cellulase M [Longilinea arvoryzae]|uniref:Cellulase M n=1 Tax=Longilinea arvoryzae TaxID=360412 RepID=A0A0S7BCP5_9CHLR|nr:M42 family metallopeptidase [Longilinea arvoryzae]GAP12544.1 cellulase M [Longilinea arvoryzae]
MALPKIDTDYLLEFATSLLNTPSPTGMAEAGIDFTERALSGYTGLEFHHTRKGALVITWPGQKDDAPRALTAHADTLGAMVKEIKENGRLKLTQIGGYAWNTVEGEGCTIFASNGQRYRGSILFNQASAHVFGSKVNETKRDGDAMEVRLDLRTTSPEETEKFGIRVGDFVAFDPRVEVNNGFLRSRHLDDKACVACLVAAVKAIHDAGLKPLQKTYLHISNYEEVGHGASAGIPAEVTELVSVDMAAVGEGQASDEYHATLCVKDSGGPYHHGLSQRLRTLAEANAIDYKVDIYPFYGSDGEAYWRAGGDVAVALIGPGVDASHNYERTHLDALVATTQWVLAYLLN